MKLSQTIILITLLVLTGCTSIGPSFKVNKGLVIENATIISTNKEGAVENYSGYVLVDNGSIIYTGSKKPRIKGIVKKNDDSPS